MTELELLQKACATEPQKAVAKRLGYSPAVINLFLKGKYTGDVEKFKRVVKQRLSKPFVDCPVLGEIKHADCQRNQTMPFSAANSQRVKLFKACHECKFNLKKKGDDS